jgi:glutamate-ammonia-ligase adenylyltransferase
MEDRQQETQAKSLGQRLKPQILPLDKRSAAARQRDIADLAKAEGLNLPESCRGFLASLATHSSYLYGLVRQSPSEAFALFEQEPEAAFDRMLTKARAACDAAQSEQEVMEVLRHMKRRTHLLIALADLGNVWDVVTVTEKITAMADCAVSAALAYLLREAAHAGKLQLEDLTQPEKGCGVVILALGKHGSRELNYSSDVDLVVFFDPGSSALVEGVEPGPLFVRMTRALVKILQERTGDGYVLRVDLRLRPDPGSTSVAISLPAAFDYYESLGQNWERAAFIKARPIAGDIATGETFIKDLTPFIWRRYFDYAAIADIHAMKRQIHAVRGHADIAVAGHDVKLGRGGIREVEFFVQTQQLVFGGRRPQLRGARTLDMLRELQKDGWVSEEAVSDLSTSYRFLRTVEHRLQMMNDEQTQRLPADAKTLEAFAKFCGFAGTKAFGKALTEHLEAVEHHYARLFEKAPGLDSTTGSLVFTGTADDPETIETLRKLGFEDPSKAIETVRGWHFGRRAAVQSPRAREVLTELVPALIEAFSGSGDPDAALAALDMALAKMPAAVELFSILKSNKAMRELFGDILGGAPRLADVVARRPHVLDAAIDPAMWDPANQNGHGYERISRLLAMQPSMEDFLDGIRDIYQEESFLIGVRLLSGSMLPREAGHSYSDLASGIVHAALSKVLLEFEGEHGEVPGGRCAVFGLGKLGSREMTASSDLDLVIIYDFDEGNPESRGKRPLHATQYYARVTQRLISALTVSTRRGSLYEVDMRLRPSGRQGPVATRLQSFRDYQMNDAETWEHMALTRARAVAGDATLVSDVDATIADIIAARRDESALANDIATMRKLIAQEKGEDDPWDLKLASGGIIDLEFLMQFLVLRDSALNRSLAPLMQSSPGEIFRTSAVNGRLKVSHAETLFSAYEEFTAVMQMTRLSVQGQFNPATAPKGVLRRIASAVNLPDFRNVGPELVAIRKQVRAIFSEVLGAKAKN